MNHEYLKIREKFSKFKFYSFCHHIFLGEQLPLSENYKNLPSDLSILNIFFFFWNSTFSFGFMEFALPITLPICPPCLSTPNRWKIESRIKLITLQRSFNISLQILYLAKKYMFDIGIFYEVGNICMHEFQTLAVSEMRE